MGRLSTSMSESFRGFHQTSQQRRRRMHLVHWVASAAAGCPWGNYVKDSSWETQAYKVVVFILESSSEHGENQAASLLRMFARFGDFAQ